jgi:hypothetical protein
MSFITQLQSQEEVSCWDGPIFFGLLVMPTRGESEKSPKSLNHMTPDANATYYLHLRRDMWSWDS